SPRRRLPAPHPSLDRRETVDEPPPAIAVTVSIDLYVSAPYAFILYESYQRLDAIRCRMSDRIRQTDPCGAAVDRRAVQRLQGLGPRPGRVFGDVHDRQAVLDGVRHGFLGGLEDAVEGPVFGVLADRGGADERRGFDRDAHLFGDPDHVPEVRDHGPRRRVRGARPV